MNSDMVADGEPSVTGTEPQTASASSGPPKRPSNEGVFVIPPAHAVASACALLNGQNDHCIHVVLHHNPRSFQCRKPPTEADLSPRAFPGPAGSSSSYDSDGDSSSGSGSSSSDSDSGSEGDDEALGSRARKAEVAARKAARPPKQQRREPGQKGKRKVFKYPRIPPEDRCGRCDHCLNPQKKKPCIPAREAQIAALKAQGKFPEETTEPAPKRRRTSSDSGSAAAAAPARPAAARPVPSGGGSASRGEALRAALAPLITATGGVAHGKAAPFVAIMGREAVPLMRNVLCTILGFTTPAALSEVMAAGAPAVLESWVVAARDAEGRESSDLLQELCHGLMGLPVDMAFLRGPGAGLSKALGSLRKHSSEAVKSAAQELVAVWLKRAKGSDGGNGCVGLE